MLEGLMRYLGFTPKENKMYVGSIVAADELNFYIFNEDGTIHAGPYGREKDAKGQLTRLRNSYTPASRRPSKEA